MRNINNEIPSKEQSELLESQEENRDKGPESFLNEIMAENFPNLWRF